MPFPDAKYPYDQRLVRAAPELLFACRELRKEMSDLADHVHHHTDSDYDLEYCNDAVDLAAAAINKAEGKESE
jgi:hypothetical protein